MRKKKGQAWPNRELQTGNTTIRQLTDEYLTGLVHCSASTYGSHARACALLVEHFGQYYTIGEITPYKANAFRIWMTAHASEKTSRLFSPITVSKHIRRATTIFQYAVDQGLLIDNPFAKVKKNEYTAVSIWNYVTMEQYEAIIAQSPHPCYRLMVSLARLAGLRRKEVVQLQWSHIDMEQRLIRVVPNSSLVTTKQRQRVVPIQPRLYRELEAAKGQAVDERVFVYPGHHNHDRVVIKMVQRAGVPEYGKPIHTLRKSLATDWLAEHPPLDVASWLGHSILVAVNHYHATLPKTLDAVRMVREEKEAKDKEINDLVQNFLRKVREEIPDWDTVRKAEQERLRRLGNGESLEAIDGIRPE